MSAWRAQQRRRHRYDRLTAHTVKTNKCILEQKKHNSCVPHFFHTLPPIPFYSYTNGVVVEPIKTEAMQHALSINQTPFALLRPLNGIPVLVRVLPAGDKQVCFVLFFHYSSYLIRTILMVICFNRCWYRPQRRILRSTVKFQLSQKRKSKMRLQKIVNKSNVIIYKLIYKDLKFNVNVIGFLAKPIGSTVQIKIPVVATVSQRRGEDGNMCMEVQSPGPTPDSSADTYVFTGTENDADVEDENVAPDTQIEYLDESGNIITEEEFNNTDNCKNDSFIVVFLVLFNVYL